MAAPRPFPIYPKKKLKHSAGCRIKIAGRAYYLGKHDSPESYAEYERLRLEHAKGIQLVKLPDAAGQTIDELVAAWIANEPRGLEDPEVQRIIAACQPLRRLFGATRANEFRANRFRALQDALASQSWMTPEEKDFRGPWSRKYLNKTTDRIIRIFKWAESTERLPMGIAEHLKTVPKLKVQDKRVKDHPPIEPADWKTQVEPCLQFFSPVVKAMVIVQQHGGLRPDEVCELKRCEVDLTSTPDVWIIRPEKHKGKWRGHDLVKVLGPISQRALAPWLMAAEPDGYVFPPAKRRNGAQHYQENGYAQAIRRAIELAKVKKWSPYKLRHAAGHAAEEVGGLAGAAAFLGHHSLETTKIYTDKQRISTAIDVAKKIG